MVRFRLTMVFTLVMSLFISGFFILNAQAQGNSTVGEESVTIPANGTASLVFSTYCLEVEKDFPAQLSNPRGLAPEEVRKVLKVAIDEGLAESDPLQTQLAIWHAVDGDWHYGEDVISHNVAQSILDKAANASLAPLAAEGTALDQAVADGTVTLSSEDFAAVDTPHISSGGQPYRGRGTLLIKNNTNQDVTVYFPFGMFFEAANDTEQDMVGFATELKTEESSSPALQATATPMVTDTGKLGATSQTTATVTATPQTTSTGSVTNTTTNQTTTPAITPTPQAQTLTLPATGGEASATLPTALILILLGIIFCLSAAVITQRQQ